HIPWGQRLRRWREHLRRLVGQRLRDRGYLLGELPDDSWRVPADLRRRRYRRLRNEAEQEWERPGVLHLPRWGGRRPWSRHRGRLHRPGLRDRVHELDHVPHDG